MLYRVAQMSLDTQTFKDRKSLLSELCATLYNHNTTNTNTALSNTPILVKNFITIWELDTVWTVYHLVIYTQYNKIHNVF